MAALCNEWVFVYCAIDLEDQWLASVQRPSRGWGPLYLKICTLISIYSTFNLLSGLFFIFIIFDSLQICVLMLLLLEANGQQKNRLWMNTH